MQKMHTHTVQTNRSEEQCGLSLWMMRSRQQGCPGKGYLHLDMSGAQFVEVQGAKDVLHPDPSNVIHLRPVVETIF